MEIAKEDKIKKESTSKSVIIGGDLHAKMKQHCINTKRKIGGVIENLIKVYLVNPKEIENMIDNLKDN